MYCLHYLCRLWVDHADDVLPVRHTSAVAGPVSCTAGLIADMVALSSAQTQVHVADTPAELGVSSTVTPLGLFHPTTR